MVILWMGIQILSLRVIEMHCLKASLIKKNSA